MKKTLWIFLIFLAFFVLLFSQGRIALAKGKTTIPRITEVIPLNSNSATKSVRVHFELSGAVNGKTVQVKYKLNGRRYSDVKMKSLKGSKKAGTVGAIQGARGSAIDIYNIPQNVKKFVYDIKVKVKQPGKGWSGWSAIHSF